MDGEVPMMESPITDWNDFGAAEIPSQEFVRAVAELLETDASDILSELGYVPSEAAVANLETVAA